MPLPAENSSSDLIDLLKDRFEISDTIDEKGNLTDNPEEIKVFSFNFLTQKGEDKGSVVVSLLDDNESSNSIKIYFGEDLANSDPATKKEWYAFLQNIRQFAKIHLLGFDVRNINKNTITRRDVEQDLKLTEADIAPMFESSFGPIDGSVKTSKQPLGSMNIIIKHSARVDPSVKNSRSRKIEKIYLSNAKGERFLLPFKSLLAARAMARHIESGGTPYDNVGGSICQLVDEMMVLNRFVRFVKGQHFEGSKEAKALEASKERYKDIKKQLSRLTSNAGYAKFHSSIPVDAGEVEEDEISEDIFNTVDLDEENQLALPYVHRAYNKFRKSDEEDEFSKWVNAAKGEGEGQDVIMDDGVENETCNLCGGGDPNCWACDGSGDKDLSKLRQSNRQEDWDDEDFGHSMAGFNESKYDREQKLSKACDRYNGHDDCDGYRKNGKKCECQCHIPKSMTESKFDREQKKAKEQIKAGKEAGQRDKQLLKQQEIEEENVRPYEMGGMNGSIPTPDAAAASGMSQLEAMQRFRGIIETNESNWSPCREYGHIWKDGEDKVFSKCQDCGAPRPKEDKPFEAEDFEHSAVRSKDITTTDPDKRTNQYRSMAGGESKQNSGKSLNESIPTHPSIHGKNPNKDYAGVGGAFEQEWRNPPDLRGLNPSFDPKAKQRFKDVTASMVRDNFYDTHSREECKAEWNRRYNKLKSMNESTPDREDNDLRNEWTPCEEYGHRYDTGDGEEWSSCIDCGEPKIDNNDIDHSHDPIISHEREKLNGVDLNDAYKHLPPYTESVSIMDDLLNEYQSLYMTEADVPSGAGFASPLTTPQVDLGSKFHTNKEIRKHGTTNGKLSPFSLISCPDKDVDNNGEEIQTMADLGRGVCNSASTGSLNSNNPLNL